MTDETRLEGAGLQDERAGDSYRRGGTLCRLGRFFRRRRRGSSSSRRISSWNVRKANRAALENLALSTGGKTVDPEEFGAFLEELLQQRETIADYREVKRTLYDSWAFFGTFVALMTLNWILRKKWGMV